MLRRVSTGGITSAGLLARGVSDVRYLPASLANLTAGLVAGTRREMLRADHKKGLVSQCRYFSMSTCSAGAAGFGGRSGDRARPRWTEVRERQGFIQCCAYVAYRGASSIKRRCSISPGAATASNQQVTRGCRSRPFGRRRFGGISVRLGRVRLGRCVPDCGVLNWDVVIVVTQNVTGDRLVTRS